MKDSPSLCTDSGLLAVLMLLPETSVVSNPRGETVLGLGTLFLPERDGADCSVREPRPDDGPLRSMPTLSFSPETRKECKN